MDDALAHEKLAEVASLIGQWNALYNRRWGKSPPYHDEDALDEQVRSGMDLVRMRTRFARDVVAAMGEHEIAKRIVEVHSQYEGSFEGARVAIVEAIAIIAQREELTAIVGPAGPRIAAKELHPVIWSSAAKLWDDGHLRAAVQTSATALEGLLQGIAGPGTSGEGLGGLFSVSDPTEGSPRLRIDGIDPSSKTWKSAHEGAAALVRGAFTGVRNLVSHPGWPDPEPAEALEMLAVLSYVARMIDRSTVATK